ncbi:MAG: crossover junction endodeoxyribonuclease RuvC [Acidobacteriia bacterium]|jgi:crossover junction endodeoxyribonuclease RuvC|nr:crossover junction endodeoxyribonuclease RuvC [Terriglobia bacterium]
MRVLGLDPAAAGTTGYGVVETDGRHCRLVQFGAERAPRVANGDACTQLQAIHALVTRLVKRYAPDVVALESVFAALNLRTALRLAEVRGVVLLAAAQCGVPVHSYSPREVKYSVTGYGHASKQQVQQMVRAQLGLAQPPQPADAADALAVALCHIYLCQARLRLRSATRRATEPTATGPSSRRRIPSAR